MLHDLIPQGSSHPIMFYWHLGVEWVHNAPADACASLRSITIIFRRIWHDRHSVLLSNTFMHRAPRNKSRYSPYHQRINRCQCRQYGWNCCYCWTRLLHRLARRRWHQIRVSIARVYILKPLRFLHRSRLCESVCHC